MAEVSNHARVRDRGVNSARPKANAKLYLMQLVCYVYNLVHGRAKTQHLYAVSSTNLQLSIESLQSQD